MKFTLSWLKDHLDTSATLIEITDMLTSLGLEVEHVIDSAAALAPFTVAYIESAEKHPGADKLRVCMVNTGQGVQQIVCGAANARAGIKVVLAKEGVTIPANGMVIKKTKIRNVESNGMLCSAEELALDMPSDGIIELPDSAVIGESIVQALGLGDPVIDIAITPNRPDCLGVRGIARDLAAAGLGAFKPLGSIAHISGAPSSVNVTIENSADCPLFVGYSILGVKNAASPDWMQQRLRAIGLRPISALVDITNYITYDLARPLHVYDTKKLKGDIRVTRAKNGEILRALNDKEYTLNDNMIAIADDSGTLGLGGIIGGVSTAVDDTTTDIFLECALFDPTAIAETGRKLGINSDARARFERGVDPGFVEEGAALAAQLIVQHCGGKASAAVIAGKNQHTPKNVPFNAARVASLGGVNVPEKECYAILSRLGFAQTGNQVTVPSFRPDIGGEADMVEEILRIHGYRHIPSTPLPAAPISTFTESDTRHRAHRIGRHWAARGLAETVTWSFISANEAEWFGGANPALSLLNPISAELSTMRPSLLPNLIGAARRNAGRGLSDLALFEIGNCFRDVTPQGQELAACTLRSGQALSRNPFSAARTVDLFDVKADAFAALESVGLNTSSLKIDRETPAWYHPARAGRITLGGKIVLGYFGELHPSLLQKMDIDFPVAGCELFLERIPQSKAKAGKTRPALSVSNFQAVERDFAFLADEKIPAADIMQAIKAVDKNLITNVSVFDIYMGKGVEPGKKSIAIGVTLQAADRTLTEEEINSLANRIMNATQALGLIIRA